MPGLEEDLGFLPLEDILVVEESGRQRITRILIADAPLDVLGIHDSPQAPAASYAAATRSSYGAFTGPAC